MDRPGWGGVGFPARFANLIRANEVLYRAPGGNHREMGIPSVIRIAGDFVRTRHVSGAADFDRARLSYRARRRSGGRVTLKSIRT